MLGIDVSNWQGEITPETAGCWKELGYEHVIVRASLETQGKKDLAQRQMDAVLAAGSGLSAYLWCYWDWDPAQSVDDALALIGDRKYHTLWLDAEEEANTGSTNHLIWWITSAIAEAKKRGVRVGIYTGAWWWNKYRMGASFAHEALWDANYNISPGEFVPYGGWVESVAHQYSSDGSLCGLHPLDLNWLSDEYIGGMAVPENPVTRAEFDALKAAFDEWKRVTDQRYTDDHGWLENGIAPKVDAHEGRIVRLENLAEKVGDLAFRPVLE